MIFSNFHFKHIEICVTKLLRISTQGHIIKPILKFQKVLQNHQKVVGHVPLGPTYGDTPEHENCKVYIIPY